MQTKKTFFRWKTEWMFVYEIINAEDYSISPEMSCFKSTNNIYFKRAQVVGVVIDKKVFEDRKDKEPFAFIEIDDGTSTVKVNAFDKPLIDRIKEIKLQGFVIVRGMVYSKVYKGSENKYIVPNTIRKSSEDEMRLVQIKMVAIRLQNHIELEYIPPAIDLKLSEYGISVDQTAEETKISVKKDRSKPEVKTKKDISDKIIGMITKKIKSSDGGVTYGDFLDYFTENNIAQNDFEKVLTKLVNDGKIVEDGNAYKLGKK